MLDLCWVKAQAPDKPYMAREIAKLPELPGECQLKMRYKIALTHFRTKHPRLEVEEDPYATLLDDDNVPMEVEVPFNDNDPIAM
ncbi:hypothetical protein BHE74_00053264 [Ensete ventricosum]|nr:hypothetical protein BHE74_00053264 [Ensete ventricosum]RZR93878.1 hypothetical protein BHM03_00022456 [Ensete ventricosum]